MSYSIRCDKAYLDSKRRIFCKVTETPCGHVFLCRLSMKWKQTNEADSCPLRRKEDETA